MVAPDVVLLSDTMDAPFCAPLLVELVTVGVTAAGAGVGPTGVATPPPGLPPPHPQNKKPDKTTAASIAPPIRI